MTDVTVVDLGLGNIRSVVRAFERLGAAVERSSDPKRVRAARRLVVPGQGAFRDGVGGLQGGLGDALRQAIGDNKPYLGICLGMQLLFDGSDECPETPGLGILPGRAVHLSNRRKVPHMGWNQVAGHHAYLPEEEWFYFVHSYCCAPSDPSVIAGTTDYEGRFCSAVAVGSLFACQFHPEKSHHAGAEVLRRFLNGGG